MLFCTEVHIVISMKTKTPEMAAAVAKVARMTRWYGKDDPRTIEAGRELTAAKLARAQAEADALKAELDGTAS